MVNVRLTVVQLLLTTIIIQSAQWLVALSLSDEEVPTVYASPFITSNISKFGLGIEGTSVNRAGRMFATGYTGDGTSGLGTMSDADDHVQQELFFKDQTGSASFNGIRFLPLSEDISRTFTSRAVATDVRNHGLFQLLEWKRDARVRLSPFCRNNSMAQPNDIALATRSGRLYLSGGNYGKVTTEVGDGDLWMCETASSFYTSSRQQLGEVEAVRLGLFGLTNGIEVSPDEKNLYLSETFLRDGEVVENKVWKFDVDSASGHLSNKTLFVDFEQLDGTGWIALDGIRADMDGNLFVTKNGPYGEVVKLSPAGKLLLKIKAPGLIETTNIDLGGPNGTSLFIVGKCQDDPVKGCSSVWHGNSAPGRAWTQLRTQI